MGKKDYAGKLTADGYEVSFKGNKSVLRLLW